jgi:hypothetical protein
MRLRTVLVLTWLVFAGLATTAGFAAVGLVGDGLDVAVAPAPGPVATPSGSPSGEVTTSTPAPTASGPATSEEPSGTAPASRTASRSVRNNFVSATCRGSSVTLSASPAPGWVLDDYRPGPAREARARFRSDSGDVEFKVSCSGGRPVFDAKDAPDNSGED